MQLAPVLLLKCKDSAWWNGATCTVSPSDGASSCVALSWGISEINQLGLSFLEVLLGQQDTAAEMINQDTVRLRLIYLRIKHWSCLSSHWQCLHYTNYMWRYANPHAANSNICQQGELWCLINVCWAYCTHSKTAIDILPEVFVCLFFLIIIKYIF